MERYRFDAYGEVTVLDADHSSDADGASDVENPFLYTGRRLDADSGLMQYRHRYYSGGLGRFVSRDPAGYVDGYCLYEYARGTPILYEDPTGEAVIAVAVTVFTTGRGVSNFILAAFYAKECAKCKMRAVGQIQRIKRNWKGNACDLAMHLKAARYGTPCNNLCVKAGIRVLRAAVWFSGTWIKYHIKFQ